MIHLCLWAFVFTLVVQSAVWESMEASIKTILLEFKIFQDQMTSFATEIISKLHENIPSEELQIIFKNENLEVRIWFQTEMD